ncbi:hypothetical protein E2P81_ATG07143 [Venturia nashicola]|nr:hypothetical protein E2P81_ATG07143 [Venturia nashicola]
MFTLPFRQASHRRNRLDHKFVTSSLQESKKITVTVEEIEEIQLSDYTPTVEQLPGTISGQVETFAQKLSPSPHQEYAAIEKPPRYKPYLAGVFDTPSPPPLPPTPRIRPIKHPSIRAWGCHRKEKKRADSFTDAPDNIPFTAPDILPLTPPATPPTKSMLSDINGIPRLSLKRAHSLDRDEEETPISEVREKKLRRTVPEPRSFDLTCLRHVWHEKHVYRVDPRENGKAFEWRGSQGCSWVEVEDKVLVVRLRKTIDIWDERMRRRWGFYRRCTVVGGLD